MPDPADDAADDAADGPATDAAIDAASLVDLAADVAGRAVDLLAGGEARGRATATSKSTATDMVSEMDRAAERLIVDTLLASRPEDGILGEEGAARPGTSGLRWVVDPLDGTTNYLYGLAGWNVSIAVEDDAGVVAGAVADGVRGETFTATRGGGAFLDGEPIRCSAADDLATALVGTGFGYDAERRRAQGAVVGALLPQVRDIRRMGAAALDLCAVACGRLDGYYEHGLAWWDLAAGALIATESGATLAPLTGGAVADGSVIASAPGIAAPLRTLLHALGAHDVP
jgi:myo-inositol-1(or 4)-monophosphatase